MSVFDVEASEVDMSPRRSRVLLNRGARKIAGSAKELTIVFDTEIVQFIRFVERVHWKDNINKRSDTQGLTRTGVSQRCWVEMHRMVRQMGLIKSPGCYRDAPLDKNERVPLRALKTSDQGTNERLKG